MAENYPGLFIYDAAHVISIIIIARTNTLLSFCGILEQPTMLVQDVTVATVDIINEEEDIDEDDEDVFVSVNGIGQVCLNWQDS